MRSLVVFVPKTKWTEFAALAEELNFIAGHGAEYKKGTKRYYVLHDYSTDERADIMKGRTFVSDAVTDAVNMCIVSDGMTEDEDGNLVSNGMYGRKHVDHVAAENGLTMVEVPLDA